MKKPLDLAIAAAGVALLFVPLETSGARRSRGPRKSHGSPRRAPGLPARR